jgi:ferredoxin
MCEFCTKHGEGKKWYLQMKNYADVLLHEVLSSSLKEIDGTTRLELGHRRFQSFMVPAITGVPSTEPSTGQPSEVEDVESRKVKRFGQVLPIEDVKEVIDKAHSITRMACGCRFLTTGKADKRYCFGLGVDKLGIFGKFPEAASSLEVIDKEEAKSIFGKYDEEGLVHSVWTLITPYVYTLCNCDRDCRPYRDYMVKGKPLRFFRAEYICEIDWELCTGCKSCMSQCQFGAMFYSSALGRVSIEPTRCFGCGLCRAQCPNDAIRLIPRSENPQVADLWLE